MKLKIIGITMAVLMLVAVAVPVGYSMLPDADPEVAGRSRHRGYSWG